MSKQKLITGFFSRTSEPLPFRKSIGPPVAKKRKVGRPRKNPILDLAVVVDPDPVVAEVADPDPVVSPDAEVVDPDPPDAEVADPDPVADAAGAVVVEVATEVSPSQQEPSTSSDPPSGSCCCSSCCCSY